MKDFDHLYMNNWPGEVWPLYADNLQARLVLLYRHVIRYPIEDMVRRHFIIEVIRYD